MDVLAQLRYSSCNGVLAIQNLFDVAVQETHAVRRCCGNVYTTLLPVPG